MHFRYCPICSNKLESRLIDGVSRNACSSSDCAFVHWDNPVPVVAALLEYRGKYLLARNARWPEAVFSLVSGYLEKNETPEQAVTREVHEELGLQSEIKQFVGYYSFQEMNQLLLIYLLRGEGKLRTNHEIAETISLSSVEMTNLSVIDIHKAKSGNWTTESLKEMRSTRANAENASNFMVFPLVQWCVKRLQL